MSTASPIASPVQTPPVYNQSSYLNADHRLKSWLFTVDHNRIALMYMMAVTVFFIVGGLLAMLVRLELLTPQADLMSYDTYNKVFTMHGVAMVFFVLIPAVPAILGNFLVPLMIGARDLAFPRINLLSFYLYCVAAGLLVYTIMAGGVDTGWTFTTPLSTHFVNTNVISAGLAAFVAGFCSILTELNFVVTVHRMHVRPNVSGRTREGSRSGPTDYLRAECLYADRGLVPCPDRLAAAGPHGRGNRSNEDPSYRSSGNCASETYGKTSTSPL